MERYRSLEIIIIFIVCQVDFLGVSDHYIKVYEHKTSFKGSGYVRDGNGSKVVVSLFCFR